MHNVKFWIIITFQCFKKPLQHIPINLLASLFQMNQLAVTQIFFERLEICLLCWKKHSKI